MTIALAALIVLGITALLLFAVAPVTDDRPEDAADLAIVGLGASLALTIVGIVRLIDGTDSPYQVYGAFEANLFSMTALGLILAIGLLVSLGARANPKGYPAGPGELYAFIACATLGGALMVGANNLLVLFMGIELSSYATYIMVGYYRTERTSSEGAAKYFVLGALSSALLLYGMSLLYGALGSIEYQAMALAFQADATSPLLWPGLALVLVGFGFKLALVPFHAWTPDAYQGAPSMVAALLSVGPKSAAAIALVVLLSTVFADGEIAGLWQRVLIVLAVVTMTVGNLQALAQTHVKRLLGYSSIAQLGNIIVGIAVATTLGYGAVLLYAIAYAFTNIAAFTAVSALRDSGVDEELASYNGLGRRAPAAALMLTIALLSLAGIPATAGFAGKLFVFTAAVQADLVWLALVGFANAALSFVYYAKIMNAMWLRSAPEGAGPVPVHGVSTATLGLCTAGILIVGLYAGPLLELLQQATATLVAMP